MPGIIGRTGTSAGENIDIRFYGDEAHASGVQCWQKEKAVHTSSAFHILLLRSCSPSRSFRLFAAYSSQVTLNDEMSAFLSALLSHR
jgi:hypothetical protein